MPLENGSSREVIGRNIAELIRAGHSKEQAAAIAYKEAGVDTARDVDINGFTTIERNPITRVGVFPYSGRGLPGADPDKVYNVLRSEEELSNPETLKSFEMLPLIDEHAMLGDGYATTPEKKGVHGWTGEKVTYDNGMVYSSLRIVSDTLKALIAKGKKELSMGYRCVFEKSSGFFQGQAYDYIQRQIRGNHIALVQQGRMGKDVAVLDGIVFDHFDIATGEDSMSKEIQDAIATLTTTVTGLAKTVGAMDEDMKAMKAKDEAEEEKKKKAAEDAEEEEKKKKEAEDKEGDDDKDDKKSMDAAIKSAMDSAIKPLQDEIAALKAQGAKGVLATITSRDQLAKSLSEVVGTFDHSAMDTADVVAYGVEKLKINAPKGHEQVALESFLAGRKAATPAAVYAMDTTGGAKSDAVAGWLGGDKKTA